MSVFSNLQNEMTRLEVLSIVKKVNNQFNKKGYVDLTNGKKAPYLIIIKP